jgi:hypothetical protein
MIALIANWKRIIYGSALALLGTLLLVQTARIDGFLFWDGLKAENEKLTSQIVSIKEAQKLAIKLAKEEKARIEAENERKAENAKLDYQKRLADNRAIIDRWMRSQAGRPTGNTNLPEASEATSGTSGTGPAPVIPDTVEIPASDLPKIAEAYAKLDALQAWAGSIGQQD